MSDHSFARLLIYATHVIEAHKNLLCELDGEVGDGDHGVSLTIGMRAGRRALQELAAPTPEQCFAAMGEAFADEVGASSGVIYEAAFSAAGRSLKGVAQLHEARHWNSILSAIAASVKEIGHAELGDKTMLDAWLPAAEAHNQHCSAGHDPAACLSAAVDAAWDGVERTTPLIPRRGRASLLGERARGHPDAGATSAYLIIRALRDGLLAPGGPILPSAQRVDCPEREDIEQSLAPWRPSVLTWQAYAPYLASGGSFSRMLEELADLDFFAAVELPSVQSATERKRIRRLVGQHQWHAMIWASDIQARERLHLAAAEGAERTRARKRFHQLLDEAAECGALRFGFCSPASVEPARRNEARHALTEELTDLAHESKKRGLALVFEGLDVQAHKKGLLGNTEELSQLARDVRAAVPGFGLVWDSAHAALNGDDLVASYRTLAPHVLIAHFSEAVLDPALPEYGDRHLPIGCGSVATPANIRNLIAHMRQDHRADGAPLFLAVEELITDYACRGADGIQRAWTYLAKNLS